MKDFVITVDEGVRIPKRAIPAGFGHGRPSAAAKYDAQLKALEVGKSFFLAGVTLKETNVLFNRAKAIGCPLKRGYTEDDEIYHTAGVRLERITVEEDAKRRRGPRKAPDAAAPAEDVDEFADAEAEADAHDNANREAPPDDDDL